MKNTIKPDYEMQQECILGDILSGEVALRAGSKRTFTTGEASQINRYRQPINDLKMKLKDHLVQAEIISNKLKNKKDVMNKMTDDYFKKEGEITEEIKKTEEELNNCENELRAFDQNQPGERSTKGKMPRKQMMVNCAKTAIFLILLDLLVMMVLWVVMRETYSISEIMVREGCLLTISGITLYEHWAYLNGDEKKSKWFFWGLLFSTGMAVFSTIHILVACFGAAPVLTATSSVFSLDQVSNMAQQAPTANPGLFSKLMSYPGLIEAILSAFGAMIIHLFTMRDDTKEKQQGGESRSRLDLLRMNKEAEKAEIQSRWNKLNTELISLKQQYDTDQELLKRDSEQDTNQYKERCKDVTKEQTNIDNLVQEIVNELSFYRSCFLATYPRIKSKAALPDYEPANTDDVKDYFNL